MLKIGEFAAMTGLSVKALRHYDENRVLMPDVVDETTGYRWYGEGQVRAGIVARLLRDAGVGLSAVAEALASSDPSEALRAHRHRVEQEREEADRAFGMSMSALQVLSAPVEVHERDRPAQPFVGQVLVVGEDLDPAAADDAANDVFRQLFERLRSIGQAPDGQPWTTLRASERGVVEVLCCLPTAHAVDGAWGDGAAFAGRLPARTELVASWFPVAGEPLRDDVMHPSGLALFDAAAERGVDVRDAEVRQEVHGETEQDAYVEVSVTISM